MSEVNKIWELEARCASLSAQLEKMRPVVYAAVTWRRIGVEGEREFAFGIEPLLDAIDVYDVGAPRPSKEL